MKAIYRTVAKWRESKSDNETWLEWLLYRKINFAGKLLVSGILWSLWLKYSFNLVFMVNFFKVIAVMGLVMGLIGVCRWLVKLLKGLRRNK